AHSVGTRRVMDVSHVDAFEGAVAGVPAVHALPADAGVLRPFEHLAAAGTIRLERAHVTARPHAAVVAPCLRAHPLAPIHAPLPPRAPAGRARARRSLPPAPAAEWPPLPSPREREAGPRSPHPPLSTARGRQASRPGPRRTRPCRPAGWTHTRTSRSRARRDR